ncbi:MAG: DNA-3-methyladenine glycosylase 2 family protein, partial [Oscillospiraceae bacterium]|nr:DNA-3-methyladenine glycosylase 2 family protein [Oscillospiraceae bacterium]
IKGIISRMCEKYDGFPSPEALAKETPESLAFLRAGFRAGYIIDAVQKVLSGETDLDSIRKMPYEEAKKQLMKIKGVGPKVADCVLLFGMYRTEAFPVDVWIKKVMANFYPDGMPECTEGYEGIAQQYLFIMQETTVIYLKNNFLLNLTFEFMNISLKYFLIFK